MTGTFSLQLSLGIFVWFEHAFFQNERTFVEIYHVIPSILVLNFIIIKKARLYDTSAGS